MYSRISKIFNITDVLLIGALLVAIALGWNTVSAMQQNYRLQQKYNQLETEVSLAEIENQNIKYKIAYLKTDDYLELAAREKFNKVIPGEAMVYLPGSGSAQKAAVAKSTVAPTSPQPKGWKANLASWVRFVQGKNALDRI